MALSAVLRVNLVLLSQCASCSNFRLRPNCSSSSSIACRRNRSHCDSQQVSRSRVSRRRSVFCRVADTETEPDSNEDEEKEERQGVEMPTSSDSVMQSSTPIDSQPITVDQIESSSVDPSAQAGTQEKEEHQDVEKPTSSDSVMQNNTPIDFQPVVVDRIESNNTDTSAQAGTQDGDNEEVASGSPLPGMKLGELVRIPKETVDILKDQVFGFDTFFVTSQEPYEGGVLFKGNLRGQAAKSYEKIAKRMENKFGDQYKLFLLVNPEDDKPVAVVVPRKTLQPETTAVPEWFAAGAFGLVTVFTLLLRNVPALQSNLLSTFDNIGLLKDGLAGALLTALVLGVHELGHILVATNTGIKLGVPYFVPSWQIGSFGAITRIVNIVPKREDLLKVASAGPLAGFSLGLTLLLLGFFLPPSDGIGIVVDASVFHESLLAGGIAKLLLGDALKEGTPISVNPLVIWAWAGLLINAINSIPAGELDGGRIAFSIWGRKASARITGASIVLLGISSLFNDVAFYWVALIFFLQRGPIAPLSEEITDPEDKYISLGVLVLILGLLVCLPYPFPFFTDEANSVLL